MFNIFRRFKAKKRRSTAPGKTKYLKHKEVARVLAHERVQFWNNHYNVAITGRIAIRNSRSRWGSCSKKGNLNFNYKLVFLPPELVDYIIVHELCHLREFNHSPRFWAHVAETIPSHRALRNKLRTISRTIK